MLTPLADIGLVNGVFDLFHAGHRRFLWEAKKRCTYLVVGVNTDESVRQRKGPTRPFDSLKFRMDQVSQYGNQVLPFDGNVQALVDSIRPHVIIRGWDQKVDAPWIATIVLPRYDDISTTEIASGRVQQ